MWQALLQQFQANQDDICVLLENGTDVAGTVQEVHAEYIQVRLFTAPHLLFIKYIPIQKICAIETKKERRN